MAKKKIVSPISDEERQGIVKKSHPPELVPIEWHIPEGVTTPFTTNMVVQRLESEFKIMFFQVNPIIRLDDSSQPSDKVRADYICGVIVTPDRVKRFVEVLQQQLDMFQGPESPT